MIETSCPRQDQFGFYQAGSFRTYSKFEAIEYCTRFNQKLTWNFNNAVFQSYDWTKEPQESLDELYRQRAVQLREKYDYLVLWFSGGADSTNILDTFIKHNIPLDEVASFVNYEATGDKLNFFNAEIYHVAVPKIQQAQQQQPWLKHTLVDLSALTMEYFTEASSKFDWIYHVNHYVNPNCSVRRDIKLKINHWSKMFDTGQRVGFIFGIDKPRVTALNNNFFFKFVDCVDNAVNAEQQTINRDWDLNELFYWSPECAKIPIKQGHIIKNWIKSNIHQSTALESESGLASRVKVTVNSQILHLDVDQMHKLIYPSWNLVPFQVKPPSLIFTDRDTWFFQLPEFDKAKHAWRMALEHRWKTTADIYKVDKDNMAKGFKHVASNFYNLGT